MTNGEWAAKYAEMGWSVFPVVMRDKVPMTKNGCLDATSDPGQVKAWWSEWPDASIGVACGEASRMWVLDIDTRVPKTKVSPSGKSSLSGTDAISALEFEHGSLPVTMTSTTGTGGRHVFFNLPANLTVRNKVNVRVDGDRRTGIDVRSTGGYVVLPPSVHSSGRQYEWDIRRPIADAPGWLLSLLFDSTGHGTEYVPLPVIPGAKDDTRAYARGALVAATKAIASCVAGSRHETIVREASSIGRYVAAGLLDPEVAATALVAAGINAGKPRAEVERAVYQQMKWAQGSPKMPKLRERPGRG